MAGSLCYKAEMSEQIFVYFLSILTFSFLKLLLIIIYACIAHSFSFSALRFPIYLQLLKQFHRQRIFRLNWIAYPYDWFSSWWNYLNDWQLTNQNYILLTLKSNVFISFSEFIHMFSFQVEQNKIKGKQNKLYFSC